MVPVLRKADSEEEQAEEESAGAGVFPSSFVADEQAAKEAAAQWPADLSQAEARAQQLVQATPKAAAMEAKIQRSEVQVDATTLREADAAALQVRTSAP